MSVVTNAILHMGLLNDQPEGDSELDRCLAAVNSFFHERGPGFVLLDNPKLPRGWYGGSKMLECTLAVGAFNYLRLDGLLAHLRVNVPWPADQRGCVQLIVKEQEDDRFRIIDIEPDAPDLDLDG